MTKSYQSMYRLWYSKSFGRSRRQYSHLVPRHPKADEELGEWYRVINTDLHGIAHMTYEAGKEWSQ